MCCNNLSQIYEDTVLSFLVVERFNLCESGIRALFSVTLSRFIKPFYDLFKYIDQMLVKIYCTNAKDRSLIEFCKLCRYCFCSTLAALVASMEKDRPAHQHSLLKAPVHFRRLPTLGYPKP